MVLKEGGLSSGWSVSHRVSHQGGLLSGWSVSHQGGQSLIRSLIGVVLHQKVNCILCQKHAEVAHNHRDSQYLAHTRTPCSLTPGLPVPHSRQDSLYLTHTRTPCKCNSFIPETPSEATHSRIACASLMPEIPSSRSKQTTAHRCC